MFRLLVSRRPPSGSRVPRWAQRILWIGAVIGCLAGCHYSGLDRMAGDRPGSVVVPTNRPILVFPPDKLATMDLAISNAIQAGQIPRGVLWLEHQPAVGPALVYHRAYGSRAVVPSVEPMTETTIFDAASLTKVIATTNGCWLE